MVNLQNRVWLIILTACLALTAVRAEIFIFTHLDHDHTGETCPICLQIEMARCLLEKLGRVGSAASLTFFAADYVKTQVRFAEIFFFPTITPVSLKIKINS
ncbi:MAG: hypothetical protein LBG05_03825 [Treponema sp.]|jgi:hypothetical protein|nr:hypothetical protein [Treponema sp.]